MKLIFHIDLNAFFASVEELYNPKLKTVPFVIAGENKHSIISTCNYEARKYGIKSAMMVSEARKLCPSMIIVSPHHERYSKSSAQFFNFLKTHFTDEIEILSIDECFLDATDLIKNYHNDVLLLAITIQKEILNKLNLSVSIGISESKFLAKMASDLKKPRGITTLYLNEINAKLYPIKIEDFVGIGKKTIPKLKLLGINTIGDFIFSKNNKELEEILGKKYNQFLEYSTGKSLCDSLSINQDIPKAIGKSITLNNLESEYDVLLRYFKFICEELVQSLYLKKIVCSTITVQIKYDISNGKSKSKTFKKEIKDLNIIYGIVKDLFFELWNEKPLRLIGISLSKLMIMK